MEGLRDGRQVPPAADRLDPGDDRDGDAGCPALLDKAEVDLVIEEHLRDDVVGPCIDLLLEHGDVELEVGRLPMLFRVAGNADAEVGLLGVLQHRVEVDPPVEIDDLLDKITGVGVPTAGGDKALHPCGGIAAQGQDVLKAEEVELDQIILDLVCSRATADEVGDHRDIEGVLDQGGEGQGPRPLAHGLAFKKAIGAFDVDDLLLVVGHVDVRRAELAELPYRFQDRLDIPSLQGRNQFKGKEGPLRLGQDVTYTHGSVSHTLEA